MNTCMPYCFCVIGDYLWLAARFNIIDKPNQRSHSSIVLRGGGIIFLFGVWIWCAFFGFRYLIFLAAGINFIDDIHCLWVNHDLYNIVEDGSLRMLNILFLGSQLEWK